MYHRYWYSGAREHTEPPRARMGRLRGDRGRDVETFVTTCFAIKTFNMRYMPHVTKYGK